MKSANAVALAWMLLFMGAISLAAGAEPPAPQRPNILLIYADDMGWGDMANQNPDSKIPTPHLDRLAREGTRFTDAHSSSGICTPSRYALLRGRYHWRSFHDIVNSFDPPVLEAERVTLPEMLQAEGYRTACIGKWHLGWDWKAILRPGAGPQRDAKNRPVYGPEAFDWSRAIPGGPRSHGFDYYLGDDVPNFPPYAWFENDRVITVPDTLLTTTAAAPEGEWEARPGPAVTGWDFFAVMPRLTERAVEWVREQRPGQPFFLYLSFTSPHAPIVPAAEFRGRSQAGPYGDFVVQTDDTVGRVLAALAEAGLERDTLVIFSADNGPEHYAYARVDNFGHRSAGPLRGVKRDIWEGGHRVPTLAWWPGHIPAGRVEAGLLGQIDFYATLAEVAGGRVEPGNAEDSLNQWPLFAGAGPSARDTLVHNTFANGYALRQGDWVLIDAPTGAVTKVPPGVAERDGYPANPWPGELYNLREDLGQRVNRYGELPEKVEAMRAELRRIQAGN